MFNMFECPHTFAHIVYVPHEFLKYIYIFVILATENYFFLKFLKNDCVSTLLSILGHPLSYREHSPTSLLVSHRIIICIKNRKQKPTSYSNQKKSSNQAQLKALLCAEALMWIWSFICFGQVPLSPKPPHCTTYAFILKRLTHMHMKL